jgi:hypothetical protein
MLFLVRLLLFVEGVWRAWDDRRNINGCRFGIVCNFADYSIVLKPVAIIAV